MSYDNKVRGDSPIGMWMTAKATETQKLSVVTRENARHKLKIWPTERGGVRLIWGGDDDTEIPLDYDGAVWLHQQLAQLFSL